MAAFEFFYRNKSQKSPMCKQSPGAELPSSPLLDPRKIGRIGKGLSTRSTQNSLNRLLQDSCDKPPLLKFSPVNETQLIKESLIFSAYSKSFFGQSKGLLYRLHKTEARLVRSVLEQSGFSNTESHDWNIMWLGCAPQAYIYEDLNQYQRINHFPNSFEITRKDRMTVHLNEMIEKFGAEDYRFFPESYVIPDDYSEFYSRYYSDKSAQWIVKPCNSSQGKGIFILDNLASLPAVEGCVVSKYISNPLLVNEHKFDLRIYVLVTSYEPLKIYIYDEGLTRFASEPYCSSTKACKFAYLTNYSVNKKNENFIQNQDWKEDNVGHKWSFSALIKVLNDNNVDADKIIAEIYDLVIKTIISIEPFVAAMSKKLSLGRNNCFDLLGFDVLIDSYLKPWLLEVNLSPSLATESPLDLYIKGNLIADTLNLVGLRFFDRKKENINKMKARLRAKAYLLKPEGKQKSKHEFSKKKTLSLNKNKLAINDLIEESSRLGNFIRIYPCEGCSIYDKYFSSVRASNKALMQFLSAQYMESLQGNDPEVLQLKTEEDEQNQLVITGDDLLVEYLSRLMHACKSASIERLKYEWKIALDKFVNHYIWLSVSSPISTSLNVLQKLQMRIDLLRVKTRTKECGEKDNDLEQKKHAIIRGFSALQLENMLRSSSKSFSKEILSCLFFESGGILSGVIKWMASTSFKNQRKAKSVMKEATGNFSENLKRKTQKAILGEQLRKTGLLLEKSRLRRPKIEEHNFDQE